jgi:ribonuclease MRP protein subunit RMP1
MSSSFPSTSSPTPSSATTTARQKQRDRAISAAIQSALRPLVPLCAGIALRHRNQHRSSAWWARFNVFRRAIKKTTTTTPTNKTSDVLARAAWLHDCVVPSAFLAFSQLTADARHATLGLALLGALATAKAATEPASSSSSLAPPQPKPRPTSTLALPPPSLSNPPATATLEGGGGGGDDDFGLAVERRSAPPTLETSTRALQQPRPPPIASSSESLIRPSDAKIKIKRFSDQQDRVKKKKPKDKSRSGTRDDISKLFDSLL